MQLLRLPWLALAFGVGIWLAPGIGAPVPAVVMWSAALVLALSMPVGPLALRLLLVAALAGALRATTARLVTDEPPALPPGVAADDREVDRLHGVVTGPVEDGAERRRLVLVADMAPGSAAGPKPGSEPGAEPGVRILVTSPVDAPPVLPGDQIIVEGYLRTPRGYRVPGATDMGRMIAGRGAALTLWAQHIEVAGTAWSPWRWPARVQRRAAARMAARGGDADGNAVARAMVLGHRGGLDRDLSQRFRDAGVAHVLAVSGLHLAVVALLAFAVVRRAWAGVAAAMPALGMRLAPAQAAALVAAPIAVAFTAVTGARVSTMRALLVVLIMLAGAAMARRARVIDALGAAALVLLVLQPATLFDPSFQLSFAATATLALALGGKRARVHAWPGRLARAVWDLGRASLWATLGTAPFAALAFGQVATGGLVANLVVVPLTELVIVPVGLLGATLVELWAAGGGVLIDIAVAAAGLVAALAGVVARVAPVLALPPPSGWELAGATLLWAAAVCGVRRLWPARAVVAVAVAGVAIIAVSWLVTAWLAPAWRDHARVTFLDVGQGDAAVIEVPGGGVWMVDSGGLPFVANAHELTEAERRRQAEGPGAHSVVPFLAARRIGRIDVVVLSHPHPDHYEGLRAVARAVDIGALWVARPPAGDGAPGRRGASSYRALLDELVARGTRIVHPALDRPLVQGGARLTALAPRYLDGTAAADPISSVNDNSLVVRVAFAGRSVLFSGDLEHEGEELLVGGYGDTLRADLVKVPHHGSRTSSTETFVRATSPAWAVISCGVANRFDFPAAEVVMRWRAAGARVLRTDRSGAITVVIEPDGTMRVDTFD